MPFVEVWLSEKLNEYAGAGERVVIVSTPPDAWAQTPTKTSVT